MFVNSGDFGKFYGKGQKVPFLSQSELTYLFLG